MYPQTHFLFSFLIGLIFTKLGVFDLRVALLVAVAGVLVDLDHYITFILRYKKMNLRESWNKHVRGLYGGRSFIHHEMGFLVMIVVVGIFFVYNKTLFWVFGLGYFSHLFLDYAHLNVFKIKGKFSVKELGFKEKITKFELWFDVILGIGVVLMLWSIL